MDPILVAFIDCEKNLDVLITSIKSKIITKLSSLFVPKAFFEMEFDDLVKPSRYTLQQKALYN